MKNKAVLLSLVAALGMTSLTSPALAQELNVYSARHYQTDEALYREFTRLTGIQVNRIEARDDELLERLRNEGANSPADVLITVDAARLTAAQELGLFAPVESELVASRIPEHLRTDTWLAFSQRARVIVFNPELVQAEQVTTYESLADPALKGKICSRSGSHPYNLSLGAALLSHIGAEATEAWARHLVDNFARPPRGGDTDQLRSVAAGECGVTITNSYYFARLMRSDKPEDQAVVANVRFVWPNQLSWGTHVNVSGAGILKNAPNKEAAVKFIEYLTSDQAQIYFADGNNEWPVVPGVRTDNPALAKMGEFKSDTTPLGTLSAGIAEAQRIFDRAGFR
ncbi:extracellular solute-binding protein [Rhodocyclaceae bacterium SMB388]